MLSPLDRVRRAHVAIMGNLDWCEYGPLLAYGKTEITDEIPTAATDGVNKLYNPEFMSKLTDQQIRFVVLHEATHIAYQHLYTWRALSEESALLANIAMDFFVNTALMDTDNGRGFIAMPEVGIPPEPKYRGWSVKQIYDDLKQNAKQVSIAKAAGELDKHLQGEGEAGDAEAAKVGEEVERLVRQGQIVKDQRQRLAGKGSSDQAGMFGDILAPRADWKKVLREFMTETCSDRDEPSWRRPNRRYMHDDVYLPSMEGEAMGEVVFGFDTSGSCFGSDHMARVVSELQSLVTEVRPSRIIVVYWDTKVVDHQIFETGSFDVAAIKPRGGGGTDASCLFDWLRKERISPQAIVQFTDGFVDSWGRSAWPTIWAVTNKNITAPFGTTIHVEV